MEITSKRVVLIATAPAGVAHEDPLVDARRFEPEAFAAAGKLKRSIFG
jgi:hypothetical protein